MSRCSCSVFPDTVSPSLRKNRVSPFEKVFPSRALDACVQSTRREKRTCSRRSLSRPSSQKNVTWAILAEDVRSAFPFRGEGVHSGGWRRIEPELDSRPKGGCPAVLLSCGVHPGWTGPLERSRLPVRFRAASAEASRGFLPAPAFRDSAGKKGSACTGQGRDDCIGTMHGTVATRLARIRHRHRWVSEAVRECHFLQ